MMQFASICGSRLSLTSPKRIASGQTQAFSTCMYKHSEYRRMKCEWQRKTNGGCIVYPSTTPYIYTAYLTHSIFMRPQTKWAFGVLTFISRCCYYWAAGVLKNGEKSAVKGWLPATKKQRLSLLIRALEPHTHKYQNGGIRSSQLLLFVVFVSVCTASGTDCRRWNRLISFSLAFCSRYNVFVVALSFNMVLPTRCKRRRTGTVEWHEHRILATR